MDEKGSATSSVVQLINNTTNAINQLSLAFAAFAEALSYAAKQFLDEFDYDELDEFDYGEREDDFDVIRQIPLIYDFKWTFEITYNRPREPPILLLISWIRLLLS